MSEKEKREIAAKIIYESDIDLENTSIKHLVDLFLQFGDKIETLGYQKALADLLTGKYHETQV